MERVLGIALSFSLLGFACSSVFGDCKCGRPLEGETTHWGGNMRVELEYKSPLKNLHGRVEVGDGPLQGALVEIFLNDEASPNGRDEKREQKRLRLVKPLGTANSVSKTFLLADTKFGQASTAVGTLHT
jgi:hypothetical protein